MTDYPIIMENINRFRIVRDDLIPGGTKVRAINVLFDHHEEYVYAGPCQGYAQIALAHACRDRNKKATLFCASRQTRHPRTIEAVKLGAKVIEVSPGYLSVVQKRAKDYVMGSGARLLPFGLYNTHMINAIAQVAIGINPVPEEVWSVAGSGTLSLALQQAWPDSIFHAVLIGQKHDKIGRAKIWIAPEKYEQDAKFPPPFPSCSNYDAKCWRFMLQYASNGALFWNVGA